MPSLPILRRGLLVITIGTAVALSHITFAAAQAGPAEGLAENSYYEMQTVVTKGGKSKQVRVQECD